MMAQIQGQQHTRPTQTEYFIGILNSIAMRSTCDFGWIGAIVVGENYILSTGYSGAPSGMPHCLSEGHSLVTIVDGDQKQTRCARAVHAEANAIVQAARLGPGLDGATMYCTDLPCFDCAKLIVQAGIVEVICATHDKTDAEVESLFKQAGIGLYYYELAKQE